MSDDLGLSSWPKAASASVLSLASGNVVRLAAQGDLGARFPWASVTKLATALGVGVQNDRGEIRWTDSVGPSGATVAHLLSHSSGLGFDAQAPTAPVGTRRIYSNLAFETLVDVLSDGASEQWMAQHVVDVLNFEDATFTNSVAWGLSGSLRDVERLATAWLRPGVLSDATWRFMTTPYLPELAGVVPGFGRFDPCPWGVGPEIKGAKSHWMGSHWSRDSFGHFGQSGSLVLLDPARDVAVVALSEEPFGPWAKTLWPEWTNDVLERVGLA